MLNKLFGVDYGINLSSAEKKVLKKFNVRKGDNVSEILGTLSNGVFKVEKVSTKFENWLNHYIRRNVFPFYQFDSVSYQYIKLENSSDSSIKLEKSVLEFLSECESGRFVPEILDSFSGNGLEALLLEGIEGRDKLVYLPGGFAMRRSFFNSVLDDSFENVSFNLGQLYKDLENFDCSEFEQVDSFVSLDILEKRLSASSDFSSGLNLEICDDSLLLFYEKCLMDYKILKDSENRICHRDLRFDRNLFSNDFKTYFGDFGMIGFDTRIVDLVKLTSSYEYDKSSECINKSFSNPDFNILFSNKSDFSNETFKVAFMDSLKYYSYMSLRPDEFSKKRIDYYFNKANFLFQSLNG